MHIARIIEYFPPHIGGMERHGLILSQEQARLGHSVDVFIGYGSDSGYSDKFSHSDYERIKTFKAPFQFLPLYSKIRRIWFNFWASWSVRKEHKKNPYNILHIHGDFIEAYFGNRLAKKLNIPAVLTIHAGLNKKFLRHRNLKFFYGINKIICVSKEIANDLEKIGIAKEKITIISSGIYLAEFNNVDKTKISELRNRYSKPILISVSVLRISKGHKYLIEAFGRLKQKYPSSSLIIIGDGPEKDNLESSAIDLNNVYFLGRQDHDKIVEYLKASDIFVSSSLNLPQDREGTPTSIMEAMAAGLPVVATKVGGSPYLVHDGINGFLANPENPQDLALALEKIINNPNLYREMRQQNLENIKSKDWVVITHLIEEVYRSVL